MTVCKICRNIYLLTYLLIFNSDSLIVVLMLCLTLIRFILIRVRQKYLEDKIMTETWTHRTFDPSSNFENGDTRKLITLNILG